MNAQLETRILLGLIGCSLAFSLRAESGDEVKAVAEPVDCKSALAIWRDAAQQGNADAQYQLGAMYWNGLGVTKNDGEAVQWLRRAADQGLAVAQYDLGVAYRDGRGVAKNETDYVQWNRKAAEQGFPPAQHNLAVQYFNGIRGMPQDNAEAMKWLRRAADQGWVPSQGMAAVIYWQGRGTEKDPVEAYKWFLLAAQGPQSATRDQLKAARAELAKSMTRAQIDNAIHAASDWAPNGVATFPDASVDRLSEEQYLAKDERIDVGFYEVTAPTGDGWKVQVDRFNGIVQFTRGDPKTKEFVMIAIRRQTIPLASSTKSENDILTAFQCGAQSAFVERGKARSYTIAESTRQKTIIADKPFYVQRNVVRDGSQIVPVTSIETLYLFLPSNWRQTGRGYAFALAQGQVSSDAPPQVDASPIQAVIAGFREK
jgi:hypothetical protein